MATVNIGGASYTLTLNAAAFAAGLNQAQRSAQAGAAGIGRQISALQAQVSGLGGAITRDLVGGFAQLGAGVVGFQALEKAIMGVVDASKQALQAQRQLNAQFGQGAGEFAKFSAEAAKGTNFTTVQFKNASSQMGTLQRNYGLTSDQIEILIKRSADLAAASGKDVVDATQRVQAALRGEAEAAEQLGLTMNDQAVQAMGAMTEEQRKNYNSLDQVTKAQIRFNELMRQSAFSQGAAAKAAGSTGDSFDKLSKSVSNLYATVAGGSAVQGLVDYLAQAATNANNILVALDTINERYFKGASQYGGIINLVTGNRRPIAGEGTNVSPGGIGPEGLGASAGPDVTALKEQIEALGKSSQVSAGQQKQLNDALNAIGGTTATADLAALTKQVDELSKAQLRARLVREQEYAHKDADRNVAALKEEQEATEETFKAQEYALRGWRDKQTKLAAEAHDSAVTSIADEAKRFDAAQKLIVQAAEDARDARLRALDQTRDAAIKAIDAETRASHEAFARQVHEAERARDAQLDDAETRHKAALQTVQDAVDSTRTLRTSLDRQRDDTRRGEDRRRSAEHDAEVKGIESTHDAWAQSFKNTEDGARAAHDERVQQIEDETRAVHDQSRDIIEGIQARAKAEEDRHNAAIDAIQKESDAAQQSINRQSEATQKAIGAQMAALDAADAKRSERSQGVRLSRAIGSATTELAQARREGTPEDIRKAQQALDDARNDALEAGERKRTEIARAELQKRANTAKEDTQARLEDERKKTAARIETEQATTDGIRKQLDEQQKAAQTSLDTALAALRSQRDITDNTLNSVLKFVESQQAAEAKSYKARVDANKASWQQVQQDSEDARRLEDAGLADARAAQDKAYEARTKALGDSYDAEQKAIHATYDDPVNGVIAKIHEAETDAEAAFTARREAAQATYDAEVLKANDAAKAVIRASETASIAAHNDFEKRKKDADTTYDEEKAHILAVYGTGDPNGPGLLDKLEKAKQETHNSLADQITDWQTWEKAVAGSDGTIQKAIDQLDALYKKVKEGKDLGLVQPPRPDDATGQAPPATPPRNARGIGGGGPGQTTAATSSKTGGRVGPYRVNFGFNEPYSNPFSAAIPNHRGVDLVRDDLPNNGRGSPVTAFESGTVAAITSDPNGGNGVIIQGPDGLYHRYFHFDSITAKSGQTVKRGDQIGILGASGTEGNPHLHYEVSRGINGDPMGSTIDPAPYLGGASAEQTITLYPLGPFGPKLKLNVKADGSMSAEGEISDFILDDAKRLGFVNPAIALQVASLEGGLKDWAAPGDYNTNGVPSSFGPLQMHYGKLGQPHWAMGLGDDFTAATGLDARDPANGPAATHYALQQAKAKGWGPWHAWTGDPWAGITHMQAGGWVHEPVLGVGKSGRKYALGESESEYVIPMSALRNIGRMPGMRPSDYNGDGGGGMSAVTALSFTLRVDGNIYGDTAMKAAIVDTVNTETRKGSIRIATR